MPSIELIYSLARTARKATGRTRRALSFLTIGALLAACDGRDGGSTTEPERLPVASVEVRPGEILLDVGHTVAMAALLESATGEPLSGRQIQWTSDDNTVAAIGQSGVVVARAAGVTMVHAASEGKRGSATVRVRAPEVPAPVPVLVAVAPNSAFVGSPELVVTVTGEGFVPESRGRWNGAERSTEVVSPTELRMVVTAADLAQPGGAEISVFSPEPGGGTSANKHFTIRVVSNPRPAIESLSPHQITSGLGGPFTMVVTGRSFTAYSKILWDGQPRETYRISPTELRTPVYASDIATPRQIAVTVENAADETRTSEPATFAVLAVPVAQLEVRNTAGGWWLWTGTLLPLDAVARDAAGRELTDRTVGWDSDPSSVAWVQGGLVRGIAPGRATIRAQVDGIELRRQVTVHAAPAYDLAYDVGVGEARHIEIRAFNSFYAPRRLPIPVPSREPAPSPDGTRIAFTGVGADGSTDVYVIGRDGSGLRRLTTDAAADDQPAWSPDGTRIAFRSTRDGWSNVWVMNADGSDQRALTHATGGWPGEPPTGSGIASAGPAWSPDSRRLVYSSVDAGGNSDLWIMRADDGSEKRRLTTTADNDFDATWSPDGRVITFRREGAGPARALVSVLAESGDQLFLFNAPGDARNPAYTPDGQWLTFSGASLDAGALSAMPADGADFPREFIRMADGGGRHSAWIVRR